MQVNTRLKLFCWKNCGPQIWSPEVWGIFVFSSSKILLVICRLITRTSQVPVIDLWSTGSLWSSVSRLFPTTALISVISLSHSFSFFLYRYPPAPTRLPFAALSLEELLSLFLCGRGIPSSVYVRYASICAVWFALPLISLVPAQFFIRDIIRPDLKIFLGHLFIYAGLSLVFLL